ncbi:MAG: DUF1549 domain-containing protein, partial [Verrucomicrobiota bacterium]
MMHGRFPFLSAGLALVLGATGRLQAEVDFNKEVLPILSDRCFICHGPDANERKAGLRLDQPGGGDQEAESGLQVIAPGHPEKSDLIERIESKDPDSIMPPPESNLTLSSEEKEILKQWIAEGAAYRAHWAFETVTNPTPPKVRAMDRVRNPIDQFVLHSLEAADHTLAPEVEKESLIRRVTFDLTGLPPTPERVEAFVKDDSARAYENLVDQLLQSKEYGERMTAEWLDVARYSDSYGYQVDRDRYVWPWRDWVVGAFNRNLPFDDFITWQVAGDLLPGAADEQILATTFNRLHSQKVEGGSVPEEFRVEYVADRTHTFGTAFLGLTLECSRCHDHKYDPITQKEYYQFASFFGRIDEAGLYSYFTNSTPTPTLLLGSDEQKEQMEKQDEALVSLEKEWDRWTESAEVKKAFDRWLDSSEEAPGSVDGELGHFPLDGLKDGKLTNLVDGGKPASTSKANLVVPARNGKALKLTGDDVVNFPIGNFRRWEPFTVALWMKAPTTMERAVVFHRSRAWT